MANETEIGSVSLATDSQEDVDVVRVELFNAPEGRKFVNVARSSCLPFLTGFERCMPR